MKQIIEYIKEGLKINKDIKIKNLFVQEILEFLYGEPEDADPKEINIFTNWVKDNKIEFITIICSEKDLKGYNPTEDIKDIINKYKNNDNVNLILQDHTFTMLGDIVYDYKPTYIFINKDNGWMCYNIEDGPQFYFVPKEISEEEASKYTMK